MESARVRQDLATKPPLRRGLFVLLIVSLAVQKALSLMYSHFKIFTFLPLSR